MATKSFFKNVHVKGRKQTQEFILALERSKQKPAKDVQMSKAVSEMTAEEMKCIKDTL